jgi:hypothetical protein
MKRVPVLHRFNFLKLTIMKACYEADAIRYEIDTDDNDVKVITPQKLTTTQLSELTGVSRGIIAAALSRYHSRGYGYFRRYKMPLTGKQGRREFAYALTEHGLDTYNRYLLNVIKGYSLDLVQGKRRKMPNFETSGLKELNTNRPFGEWSRDITADMLVDYMRVSYYGRDSLGITKDQKVLYGDKIWRRDTSTKEIRSNIECSN